MAFRNEYISREDVEKYGLETVDEKFIVGGTRARDWTIDRDREIYLRVVARGREEFAHLSTWTMYWKGELMEVDIENISTAAPIGGEGRAHKRVRRISIPPRLETERSLILSDLKEALTAYKTGGVFSTVSSYSLQLDV
jgi:hypothetical protein